MEMTLAAGRFFAADWESASFIEFFVDLQLRVADDAQAGVGRTVARLRDHSRFALQVTLLRSVDSYLAYLGEIEAAVLESRRNGPLVDLLDGIGSRGSGVPSDAGERFLPALTHGNILQLGRLFTQSTQIDLFGDKDDVAILTRLVSIRNLVAHGRTFGSDELASLVDETVSVGGLGLRLREVRSDFDYLRSSVVRIDDEVAAKWHLPRPISRDSLFAAIAAASKADVEDETSAEDLPQKWLDA